MLEIVASIVALVVGGVLADATIGRAWRARLSSRQQAAEEGYEFDVPAKLRLLEHSGVRGRWREGILYRDGGKLMFRPRRPRRAQTLDLSGLVRTGTRPAKQREKWWFAGPTVLLATGNLGAVELGFGLDDYLALAHDLIDPSAQDR